MGINGRVALLDGIRRISQFVFLYQAEDGIRDDLVTGVQTCALPISGYGGVSLYPEAVRAYRPTLEIDAATHRFKYRPDFSQLAITEQTGFVLFSRPCNPTGNVLTDAEVQRIASLAADVPVFIDSAYAPPFPALNFTEMTPELAPNVVHEIGRAHV